MSMKKVLAIAVAAGALAAVSVPAMAFENEFHGMFRLRALMTNFENTAGGTFATDKLDRTMTVVEQRARLQYIAKASDDLKLVTHFEIDASWGDAAYANGRGTGGGMGADTVNLETKNVYLDFNALDKTNFKVGIQPVSDAYKGIFFIDDVAGAFASKKFGALTATAGFSRLQDFAGANALGRQTLDLYLLDAKFALSKDLTLGGSYYLVRRDDQYKGQDVHMVGVNAAAKFGIVTADAFVAFQAGDSLANGVTKATDQELSAWAAQVAAKADLGAAGAIRANVLYASGDSGNNARKTKAFQSINSSSGANNVFGTSSNSYYDSKMLLLMRNVVNMDADKAMVQTTNNGNQGVTLGVLGYDATFSPKLGASLNVGYAMASNKYKTTADKSLGTELNAQLDYKLFPSLTNSIMAAYVVLGDHYKGTGTGVAAGSLPSNPYLIGYMMNYTF